MMHHPNLLPFQQSAQRLADRFNDDERFWHSLRGRRNLRRKFLPWLTEKEQKFLDELKFSRRRPPDDCIGKAL